MLDLFTYTFFQNAVLSTLLASVACGIVGTYITVKRMSVISGSIAHTAFGGLGIATFFGFPPMLGAVGISLLAAWGIALFRQRARERFDVLLNALWATGMAVGLLFLFFTPGYHGDMFSYLFGNILLIGWSDVLVSLLLATVVISTVVTLYPLLLTVTFDEHYAITRNLPVGTAMTILLSLIALTIVLTLRVVGIVLIIALLSMPAATAQLFTRKLSHMMLVSIALCLLETIGGLLLATTLNIPPGPTITLMVTAFYLIALIVSPKQS